MNVRRPSVGTILAAGVAAWAGSTGGCASRGLGERAYQAEMAIVPVNGREITVSTHLEQYVSIIQVDRKGKVRPASSEAGATPAQLLYLYTIMDVSKALANPGLGETAVGDAWRAKRREFAHIGLAVCDLNHEIFFNRMFAFSKTGNVLRDTTKTLFLGGAGTAAIFEGVAGTAIAAAGLGVDAAWSEINAEFFYNKTIDAIDRAVQSERGLLRQQVLDKIEADGGAVPQYTIPLLIADLRQYANTSSLRFVSQVINESADETATANAATVTAQRSGVAAPQVVRADPLTAGRPLMTGRQLRAAQERKP